MKEEKKDERRLGRDVPRLLARLRVRKGRRLDGHPVIEGDRGKEAESL